MVCNVVQSLARSVAALLRRKSLLRRVPRKHAHALAHMF